MTIDQILLRFFQVVARDLKHKHYAHTTKKKKDYMAVVAGVGLDDKLKQYARRESPELFEQRKRLTNHITTAVSKNLLDPFYKVPRSNSGRRVLSYSDKNEKDTRVREMEGVLKGYWGDESWDDWMATRFIELNAVDPNAFEVKEWKAFDALTERISPYPYEVSSEMAVDYRYQNKVLQYLVARDAHTFRNVPTNVNDTAAIIGPQALPEPGKDTTKGHKFTLYTADQTFQLLEVHANRASGGTLDLIEGKVNDGVDDNGQPTQYVKLGNKFYEFKTFEPHNCGKVPASRVGYLRDIATGGETFVSPIEPAMPYLLKTIKVNSEFDLVTTLLALPQQVMYGEECPDTDCYKGTYRSGKTCQTCHGTGLKATAPSAQDAILLRMPKSKEELIPLQDIITYIHPPVDIVKFQQEYVEHLTVKARQIMFNSDIFDRKQIAETAMGKGIDMQNVYDTLYPFAVKWGKTWTAGVELMAKLADLDTGLVASYTFGKDFKMKTLDSLVLDLSIANNTGNAVLVEHINYDIAQIIFAEKPLEMQRYQMKEAFNPFTGKGEKEIMLLLVSDLVPRRDKVLHANYGRIFDELEIDYMNKSKNFYTLGRIAQRQAIYDKVDEIIATLAAENPAPVLDLGE